MTTETLSTTSTTSTTAAGGRHAVPSTRITGTVLLAAATIYFVAWLLVPVAGVTDAREIIRLVSESRGPMLASSILQLVSMALYVPAMIGLIRKTGLPYHSRIWVPATVVILGTLGGVGDAMDHILAYAMTAPGVDQAAMGDVMAFMQGPALVLISPLILAWFVGVGWLSIELARAGVVPKANAWLYAVAPAVAVVGAALATWTDLLSTRMVGILTIGVISAAQVGVAVALRRPVPAPAPAAAQP